MSVIVYDPARLGALAAQGIADNPLFLFENDAGSFAVPGGTASGGPVENLLTDATSKYCLPIGGVVTFSTSAPITCAAIIPPVVSACGLIRVRGERTRPGSQTRDLGPRAPDCWLAKLGSRSVRPRHNLIPEPRGPELCQ